MSELHHECGIAGIYFMSGKGTHDLLPANQMIEVSRLVPRMLLDLQNRGQLAAGISTFNETRDRLVETFKDVGSVIEAFQLNHEQTYKKLMNDLAGQAAIGHVRYATCGADDVNWHSRWSESTAANGSGSASLSTVNSPTTPILPTP